MSLDTTAKEIHDSECRCGTWPCTDSPWRLENERRMMDLRLRATARLAGSEAP